MVIMSNEIMRHATAAAGGGHVCPTEAQVVFDCPEYALAQAFDDWRFEMDVTDEETEQW